MGRLHERLNSSEAEFPDSLRKVFLDGCNGTGRGGRDRAAAVRVLSFCLSYPKVLGFMDCSKLSTKAVFPISDSCGDEAKVDPSIDSCHVLLWVYDYFLTLEDEVRCPSIFQSKSQVLTLAQINYAWSGSRFWSELPPPRLIFNSPYGYSTVFVLFIAVRHPKNTSGCDGLDSTLEQVHSHVPRTLQHSLSPGSRTIYPHRRFSPLYNPTAIKLPYGKPSFIRPPSSFRSNHGCVKL